MSIGTRYKTIQSAEQCAHLGEPANGLFANGRIVLQCQAQWPEGVGDVLYSSARLHCHLLRGAVNVNNLVKERQADHALWLEGEAIGREASASTPQLPPCVNCECDFDVSC